MVKGVATKEKTKLRAAWEHFNPEDQDNGDGLETDEKTLLKAEIVKLKEALDKQAKDLVVPSAERLKETESELSKTMFQKKHGNLLVVAAALFSQFKETPDTTGLHKRMPTFGTFL
jgi:hypothetical protein